MNINKKQCMAMSFIATAIISFTAGYLCAQPKAEVKVPPQDNKPNVERPAEEENKSPTEYIKMKDVKLDGYKLGDNDIPSEYYVEKDSKGAALIASTSPSTEFEGIRVGSTYLDVKNAFEGKYEPFYSIHSPDHPNTGWYILNDNYEIVIFDFDLEDYSFVNEGVTDESTVKGIVIAKLSFFD